MSRSVRQAMAVAALVVAGAASLATSKSAPGLYTGASDVVSFAAGEEQVVRHVGMSLATGEAQLDTQASVRVDTEPVNERGAVAVTIVRDSDRHVFHQDWRGRSDDLEGIQAEFTPFGTCTARTVCKDSFTITFSRVPDDDRPELQFEWQVSASALVDTGDFSASQPADASFDVEIWK